MKRSLLTNTIVALLALACGHDLAWAALSGPVPVTVLVNRSELAVAGMVIRGQHSRGSTSLEIRIDRVLKGDLSSGQSVSATWQSASAVPTPDRTLSGVRGLFFANRGDAGTWVLVPATDGAIYDVLETFFVLPADNDSVTYGSGDSPVDKIIRELMPSERWRKKQGRNASISVVDTVLGAPNSRALTDVSKHLLTSGLAEDRTDAMQTLIILGDVSTLSLIELDQADLIAPASGVALTETVKRYYKSTDSTGVTILGRLLESTPYTSLRQACAAALARIHTVQALTSLAKLLNSPDLQLQAYAVGGLAMFANNVPIGSHEPGPGPWKYRTQETIRHSVMDPKALSANGSFYLDFWKQWWIDHQADLSK